MTQKPFVHLHVHTEYSLLDGACRIKPLCEKVASFGSPACAITDHGNLFGAIDFYKSARARGLKPLIGSEVYIAQDSRFEKTASEQRRLHHLVLLAKDYQGYLNLAKLSTIGFLEGFYHKPRIDREVLARHSGGLIALSACLKGAISEAILAKDARLADTRADELVQTFGRENVFLELIETGLHEQKIVNKALLPLAKRHRLQVVATNDCHYLNKGDHEIHDVLLCIQTNKTINDERRMRFNSQEFYVRSPEEMWQIFAEVPEALLNTLKVAEMCNVEIPFGQKLMPHYEPPNGKSPYEFLRELVLEGLERRYKKPTQVHIQRAEEELDIIHAMGFDSYFLIVWDFVNYARTHGIAVGPGRGSVGGSLVAYALQITDIDPLEFGLLFERFLNPGRISMPDIDIDFCWERRGEVIAYVKEKYGERNVAQIITFGTMKAKNAVRDVGRALAIPLGAVDRIARMIPDNAELPQALKEVPDLKRACDEDPQIRKLMDVAIALEGTHRNASTHAAGVVIADVDLSTIVPLYRGTQEQGVATQYAMQQVEELGLLKMDFLGLKNLTVIEDAMERIGKIHGVTIDWDAIPLNDEKTFRLLQSGETAGVFQLESAGMSDLSIRLRPESFEDIVVLLSLFRPGPLQSGAQEELLARKHGKKEIVYDHPQLEPILRETYGVILYQEQVTKIASILGGFSLSEADLLRRAMGKKKAEEMLSQREMFVSRATDQGADRMVAEKIFDNMANFAGYGFNKSHSAAYAVITYRTAYLKAHYPVEYMAALMSGDIRNNEKIAFYFGVCRKMGIRILPPDVNESFATFTAVSENIRFGLAAVRNVGGTAVGEIIEARKTGGPFHSFHDFCKRVNLSALNLRMLEALVRCGAFDSLGATRPQLLQILPRVLDLAGVYQRERFAPQVSLFDLLTDIRSEDPFEELLLPTVENWSDKEKLQNEKEYIGFYVSGHPLDRFLVDLQSFSSASTGGLANLSEGASVHLLGIITKCSTKLDKRGNTMAFATLEDFEGTVELVIFREAYEKHKELLVADSVVWVEGNYNSRSGKKITVRRVTTVEHVRQRLAKCVTITLPPESASEDNLKALRSVFARHKGSCRVRLIIDAEGTGRIKILTGKSLGLAPSSELISEISALEFQKVLTFSQN